MNATDTRLTELLKELEDINRRIAAGIKELGIDNQEKPVNNRLGKDA